MALLTDLETLNYVGQNGLPFAVFVGSGLSASTTLDYVGQDALPFYAQDGALTPIPNFEPAANIITLTAPAPVVHLTMPVSANVVTLSAPSIHAKTLYRDFPLVRDEMQVFSQQGTHQFPYFDIQDPDLIP